MEQHPMQRMINTFSDVARFYGGPGMGGKQCLGVVTTRGGIGELFACIIDALADDTSRGGHTDDPVQDSINRMREIADAVRSMRTQDTGIGTIVYFPDVPFVDPSQEIASEDDPDGDDEDEDT